MTLTGFLLFKDADEFYLQDIAMTKPARNEQEVEVIKNLILDNALYILIHDGFDMLTMRKIASRSGMSATNIYNYFSNKDEIYLSIVIRGFEKLHSRFQSICETYTDPLERGRELAMAYFNFGFDERHYYEIMFTRSTPKYNDYLGTPMEKLAAVEMDYSMKIVEMAGRAIEEVTSSRQGPDTNSDNTGMKVMQVWGLLHGIISLYHSNIAQYIVSDSSQVVEKIMSDITTLIKPS